MASVALSTSLPMTRVSYPMDRLMTPCQRPESPSTAPLTSMNPLGFLHRWYLPFLRYARRMLVPALHPRIEHTAGHSTLPETSAFALIIPYRGRCALGSSGRSRFPLPSISCCVLGRGASNPNRSDGCTAVTVRSSPRSAETTVRTAQAGLLD